MAKLRRQDALDYHEQGRPGKIEVVPTKSYSSQRDLSLAYSPGVAEPCLEIEKHPEDAYRYTAKGNLVAVISNGTAVLGLGNIGALASKPVMEGKGLLFKIFADIDVFDIEVDSESIEHFISTVKAIAPTFGGINLEDIKAPECFEIEERLKAELDIPVMHDDQHGTAIISTAGLLNALEIAKKKTKDVRVVINGAGASAVSCTKLFLAVGVQKKNIIMCDSKGVIYEGREDLNEQKKFFAVKTKLRTLEESMKKADVFLGLSMGNVVSQKMIKSMAKKPIVFALANPDPEIPYADAIAARKDIIMATGRSDHPNQVNNVLGFPYIFRGALDVRATCINEEMKLACVYAIASLAKEPVPEMVLNAYSQKNLKFGDQYIIPKPLDQRLITIVAPAVAQAAIDSGVSKLKNFDIEKYKAELSKRLGLDNKLTRSISNRAKANPKTVLFAEADHPSILKAAQQVKDEGIAEPILLGNKPDIIALIEEHDLDLEGVQIIDPRAKSESKRRKEYAKAYYAKRKRRGITLLDAEKLMQERNFFGTMMVEKDEADALISGLTRKYPDVIKPALQILGTREGVSKVAGMYILNTQKYGPLFFADTTVNMNPTAEDLAEIANLTAHAVEFFGVEPKVAMLSYSNFGSSETKDSIKVQDAVALLHKKHPKLVVDGELQANFALNKDMLTEKFPFTELAKTGANTLIFPNLESGNIAYKLIQELGAAETIGPVILGLNKPVHILQLGSSVRDIVNMVTVAVVDAQSRD
jgi:malate dehydrogenase (oxaloacetate-decarboxylating)(NADP+)